MEKRFNSGMLHRAYLVCSSWTSLNCEIEKIMLFLKSNNYSEQFVNKIIKQFISDKVTKCYNIFNIKKQKDVKYTFLLPYVGNPSLVLKKKLRNIFKSNNIDVNIVFSSFKVGNYFSLDDKRDQVLKASLIYKFQCLDDPSVTYIGKTKRYLQKRITEHEKNGSAIYNHMGTCGQCKRHGISKCFKVLIKGNTDFDLTILEALQIRDKNPSLNKQLTNDGSTFILNVFK